MVLRCCSWRLCSCSCWTVDGLVLFGAIWIVRWRGLAWMGWLGDRCWDCLPSSGRMSLGCFCWIFVIFCCGWVWLSILFVAFLSRGCWFGIVAFVGMSCSHCLLVLVYMLSCGRGCWFWLVLGCFWFCLPMLLVG